MIFFGVVGLYKVLCFLSRGEGDFEVSSAFIILRFLVWTVKLLPKEAIIPPCFLGLAVGLLSLSRLPSLLFSTGLIKSISSWNFFTCISTLFYVIARDYLALIAISAIWSILNFVFNMILFRSKFLRYNSYPVNFDFFLFSGSTD